MSSHIALGRLKSIGEKRLNGFPIPMILTGKSGTGKSHVISDFAKHKGLRYGYMSCNGQTSKSDIIGFTDAMGKQRISMFYDFYKNGGVFCFEEIDTVHADLIVIINTIIDSSKGSFGNELLERHKDFYLLATSNTYNGATDEYTARKLLDQSTLERFIKVNIELDPILEEKLMGIDYKVVQFVRGILKKDTNFSTRSALMFIQMKDEGMIEALRATAFRNNEHMLEMSSIKDIIEEYINSSKLGYKNLKVINIEDIKTYIKKVKKDTKNIDFYIPTKIKDLIDDK